MKWIKVLAPVAVLAIGGALAFGVVATAPQGAESEPVDTRPVVTVSTLSPIDYTVTITSYGEVAPLESTRLAAQIAGEITHWNPAFVSGGLVRRGEVLYSIEKDAYEAALLLAQSNLSSARAQLIQEQAQARVAEREAQSLPSASVSDLYLRKPQMLSAQAAVKSAEAQLKIAQRDLDNCDVKAPYDALVVSRDIGTGDYVTPGTLTATLNNVENAEVTFPVAGFDQPFLPADLVSSHARVSLPNQQQSFAARIHRDSGMIDSATRMTHLVLRIDDPYGLRSGQPKVKFGTYVNVSFEGKILEDVYRIEQELVTNSTLWLLDDEDKLYSRKVKVLREEGGDFYLRGDFADRKIVNTLPEYPQDGMAVKVIKKPYDDLVAHRTIH